MTDDISPDRLIETGMAFFAAKTLLSAVELGVFTELADGPRSCTELEHSLEIDGRASRDFLDALVALDFLEREDGQYSNTPETDAYLDRAKPEYVGSALELANDHLYPSWGQLTTALRTGEPQHGLDDEEGYFETLYEDPARLRTYANAMSGFSLSVATTLATDFEWDAYETMCDLGAAEGIVPITVAESHDHLRATAFDRPALEPVTTARIRSHGLSDRVSFHGGDFFTDELPEHDVFVLGNVLHNWRLEERQTLLTRVYEALSPGGVLIVYGTMIDPDRRTNETALLMSLNMLLRTQAGSDYTTTDCDRWLTAAGFAETERRTVPGGRSMFVARK